MRFGLCEVWGVLGDEMIGALGPGGLWGSDCVATLMVACSLYSFLDLRFD